MWSVSSGRKGGWEGAGNLLWEQKEFNKAFSHQSKRHYYQMGTGLLVTSWESPAEGTTGSSASLFHSKHSRPNRNLHTELHLEPPGRVSWWRTRHFLPELHGVCLPLCSSVEPSDAELRVCVLLFGLDELLLMMGAVFRWFRDPQRTQRCTWPLPWSAGPRGSGWGGPGAWGPSLCGGPGRSSRSGGTCSRRPAGTTQQHHVGFTGFVSV